MVRSSSGNDSPIPPLISAALIVRDEAARLGACLSALKDVVDEIVTVDTGSRDETREIAVAHGAQVFEFSWRDDFAAARNFALDHCTGTYILTIDADEIVEDALRAGETLREFVQNHKANTVGTIEIVNLIAGEDEPGETIDHTERFFARESFRYTGAIHEQLMPVQGRKDAHPTGLRVRHTGYHLDPEAAARKAARNLRLLKKALEACPEDEYFWYQAGKSHAVTGDHAAAAAAFNAALKNLCFDDVSIPRGRLGAVSRKVLTDLAVAHAHALANLERVAEARRLLEWHLDLGHPGVARADFHHALGYVCLMQGDLARSRAGFDEALRLGPGAEDVRGTGSYGAAYHLGLLAEASDALAEALRHYARALRFHPAHGQSIRRLLELIVERGLVVPPEIRNAWDPGVSHALYLDKLGAYLDNGELASATALAEGAAVLSPALLEECVRRIELKLREKR